MPIVVVVVVVDVSNLIEASVDNVWLVLGLVGAGAGVPVEGPPSNPKFKRRLNSKFNMAVFF
jgi:hypothetical protein